MISSKPNENACMNQKCVIGNLREVNAELEQFIVKEMKAMAFKVSKKHIPLFYILPEDGGLMVFNELASRWGISKSSLSDIVNKYAALSFLEKHECRDDKRLIYLQLTSDGIEVRKELGRIEEAFKKTIYKNISSNEQATFETVLDKILNNIQL